MQELLYCAGVRVTYETEPSRKIHWHDTLQIVYQLSGKSRVILRGRQYLMHEADLLVVNPYELHNAELLGSSAALSFCFAQPLLSRLKGARFDCVSCLHTKWEQAKFTALRAELAALFQHYYSEQEERELELLSHAYSLFHLLLTGFRSDTDSEGGVDQPRVSRMMQYLHTHYTEEITLRDLARREYLTPNYLSQFFRNKLGTTFTQYLNEIRLDHCFFELCSTSKTVTEIALDNGFGRVDTFIEHFRRKYEITPGKFRKGLQNIDCTDPKLVPQSALEKRFEPLLRYAAATAQETVTEKPPQKRRLMVEAGGGGAPVVQDWRTIVNAGYADDCFTAEVQQQLAVLQRAVGFTYVRFHGIFSDTMHVYQEDAGGNPTPRFTCVDLLLDRLLAMGLKPYIEFGFLPRLLAGRQKPVYQNQSYIGFPSDLHKWTRLVEAFLRHCIRRYGRSAVCTWRFTLFSISFSLYGFLSAEEYGTLYRETQRTVKRVDAGLRFGGPGIEGSLLLDGEESILTGFLEDCRRQACLPDFVTMHSFPHSFREIAMDFNRMVHRSDSSATFKLSENERFMGDCIAAMDKTLRALCLDELPVLIDEWNATIWQRDLCSDTCYKAVHVVKNLVENMGRTAGKAYWTVSDLINDWKLADTLFHGGHGMFTCNGIPKPVFYAYQLLSRMGDRLLASGDGWYITRGKGGVQILLYNYCHYNTMYRMLSAFQDPSDRYSAFRQGGPVEYHISVEGLAGGGFRCETVRLGRESGSAYDEWLRLGAPEELTAIEIDYLKQKAEPVRRIEQRVSLRDMQIRLEALEVVQMLIEPMDR